MLPTSRLIGYQFLILSIPCIMKPYNPKLSPYKGTTEIPNRLNEFLSFDPDSQPPS